MESLVVDSGFWKGRSVLVTGHTGFKGAWLSLWLHRLGAQVHGLALDPPTDPSLFETADVASVLSSDARIDIRNSDATLAELARIRPETIFHLAAQSLVSHSYLQPIETFEVNVVGTAQILQAARQTPSVTTVVVVTSDKCYADTHAGRAHTETDELGGADPYSSSKACAELVTSAYRRAYLEAAKISTATARAGNVIGGGDWAANRLLPDCVRARGGTLRMRFPHAVRPWQHVLEPLCGYLQLAQVLHGPDSDKFCQGWNFGPPASDTVSVKEVVDTVQSIWPDAFTVETIAPTHRETSSLLLDATKAHTQLGWSPRWSVKRAIHETLAWYEAAARGLNMHEFSLDQISEYAAATPQ